ncbi:MAG: M48 family metallopeptidase [Candidatus Cloacimonetes bacterium]|nr:M48 family metallopeptidase [Candidatus Cloacimonadota bacterium]
MWELIASNKRKSIILFSTMGLLLLLLGYFIGSYFFGEQGGLLGLGIAVFFWLLSSLLSFLGGDQLILGMSRAREATDILHPQLFNIVEEMKIAANLPYMPKVYVIPDSSPNAFATGRNPEKSSIVVTAGLLNILNRDELQGVIAHEMSHIINRDILFMTFAGVMLGSIVMLSHFFLRSFWFGGSSRKRFSSGTASKSGIPILVLALVLSIFAPILARILYFSISRKREFLADASAVRLTRYPPGLASALAKISSSPLILEHVNKATSAFYISDPYYNKKTMAFSSGTHPPIAKRISILKSLSHGIDYLDYQNAYSKFSGNKRSNIIPSSGLTDNKNLKIRKPFEDTSPLGNLGGKHGLGDMIRSINNFAFIVCSCGLKFKIPPEFPNPEIVCPRCGTFNVVPIPNLDGIADILDSHAPQKNQSKDVINEVQRAKNSGDSLVYTRKTKGWESFVCTCGSAKQLSPAFNREYFICSDCGRKIIIKK